MMDELTDFAAQIAAQKRDLQAAKARKGQKATNKASRHQAAFGYHFVRLSDDPLPCLAISVYHY